MAEIPAAKILQESKPLLYPGKLSVKEIFFEVPKDYSAPGHGNLRIFARSVGRHQKPVEMSKPQKDSTDHAWFVYLQGGPGISCSSPSDTPWVQSIVEKGYNVLLLDQRGTGLSSPISARTLGLEGGHEQQARLLKLFRADNIVRDCEAIREALTHAYPPERKRWTLMGQSFGGFCCVNYLSRFPQGLREVFTIGGLPPLTQDIDTVYRHLFEKVRERNKAYYEKYEDDIRRVRDIVDYLIGNSVILPSGGHMSVLRFRQLGILFGFHGGVDTVHGIQKPINFGDLADVPPSEMVLRLSCDLYQFRFFTRQSMAAFENLQGFDDYPLYALLHEPLYAQGIAPEWSADRVMRLLRDFTDIRLAPILFTGEMVSRAMFDDYAGLAGLMETADILAYSNEWPELYDEEQLARNKVPVYSATFIEDMYVDYDFARETASKIKNCKNYVTNNMYHNAISQKTDEVLKKLFDLRDDVID